MHFLANGCSAKMLAHSAVAETRVEKRELPHQLIRRGAGYSVAWSIKVQYSILSTSGFTWRRSMAAGPAPESMEWRVASAGSCGALHGVTVSKDPLENTKSIYIHPFATPVMSCDASVVLTLFGRYEAQRWELPSQRPSSLPDGGTGCWSPGTRAQSLGCWPYTIESHEQKYH